MLLVVINHTFPPFGGITNTITLANIMANHIMHNLKHNRIWLIASFTTKKMSKERQTTVRDPYFLIKDELNL
jgi:hypothetical protein